MPVVTNSRLIFNKIPDGYPRPGETTRIDRSQNIDLDAPLNGGVLIKVLMLAIDPYMRGKMRDPNIKSYTPAYILGKPLDNFGIGLVIKSDNPQVKAGQHVYGILEFQEYLIKKDAERFTVVNNEQNLPWTVYLSTLGLPGQTAYIGWKLFSGAKKGETVFVTSAAGGVGSNVVQIAKGQGLKVIATAGSNDKVKFVQGLGADVVFNYREEGTKALKELGHGIDIFWDGVGGEMLEAAIDAMNDFGRAIICGSISTYNSADKYGIKNMELVLTKRLNLRGFIVMDHFREELPNFYREYGQKVASGEIRHSEQIYRGLEGAEKALQDQQKGENDAKPVVVLAEK